MKVLTFYSNGRMAQLSSETATFPILLWAPSRLNWTKIKSRLVWSNEILIIFAQWRRHYGRQWNWQSNRSASPLRIVDAYLAFWLDHFYSSHHRSFFSAKPQNIESIFSRPMHWNSTANGSLQLEFLKGFEPMTIRESILPTTKPLRSQEWLVAIQMQPHL